MHGGHVAKSKLPSRPHLDHLRRQAKTLLAELKQGEPNAIQSFVDHLPEAKRMTADAVRAAGFRLADAQSVVARQTGFASWPGLSRHVQELRGLEGEWHFSSLEIDGTAVPAVAFTSSRMLIDGDRFRMESPEATYEGIFTIDADATPPQIDIDFVEGPEAGNRCEGIFELDGDDVRFCLSLGGASRPTAFATSAGCGHALERLRRASAARPDNVTGGTAPPPAPPVAIELGDPAAFEVRMTELLRRLEGDWVPVELVMDGKPMPNEWLSLGSRKGTGNEVKVVIGGQTVVHAKIRLDETTSPMAIDYLTLSGKEIGAVGYGILDWIGDEVRFLTAPSGHPRPTDFASPPRASTLSRWRRR
jgi:uncharacterized protein (TIGR03067 family)